jgi:PhoPQ-activated pathogenicity-related protein
VRDYKILKTLQPIVINQARAEYLAPTALERIANNPYPNTTLTGLALKAAAPAAKAAVRGAAAPVAVANTALAALYRAQAMGQPITPALIAAARAAGIGDKTLRPFAESHPRVP